jgi:hypothetical protein
MPHFAVHLRVLMVIFTPRDSVPMGHFDLDKISWNVPRISVVTSDKPGCCYTEGLFLESGRKKGLFQGHPLQFDPESGHKVLAQSRNAKRSLARAYFLDNDVDRG